MSALLRDDQPKTSKSPASSSNSFENIRFVVRLFDYSIKFYPTFKMSKTHSISLYISHFDITLSERNENLF